MPFPILHHMVRLLARIRAARVSSLAICVTALGCSSAHGVASLPSDSSTSVDAATTIVDSPGDGAPRGVPADVLDLTNWKLALPIPRSDGFAVEISQPALRTYSVDPYFRVNGTRDGVAFAANCGGATTKGSRFPRSELREMINSGSASASWSPTSGTHTMVVTEAVVHLPVARPEVVTAQIHDGVQDIVMLHLNRSVLFVDHNGLNLGVLDANYVLGTTFTAKIVASGGKIQVYYNDMLKSESTNAAVGCYFKAGCYTHSNTTFGDSPDAYAEVVIYDLKVQHN